MKCSERNMQRNERNRKIGSFLFALHAACPPQWVEFEDQNSIFGVRYDAYRTLAACQDYCAGTAACVAVDFNYDEDSCWLHLDPRDLLDENTYSQDNTHQYRIDRTCAADTTLSGLLSVKDSR